MLMCVVQTPAVSHWDHAGKSTYLPTYLIDFLPIGISKAFTAPEFLEKVHDGITEFKSILAASVDVYLLGLMLYMVAEEKFRDIYPIVWHDRQMSKWYREIVERCLISDPDSRLLAVEVLLLLQSGSES